jgi:hypothetical protein
VKHKGQQNDNPNPNKSPHECHRALKPGLFFSGIGENQISIRQVFDLQKGSPWSGEILKLTRKVIHQKNELSLVRKLFWVDISHLSRLLAGLAFFGSMAGTLSLALFFQELITAMVMSKA